MSKEILQSNLLEPGASFIVNETAKDTVMSPGTSGFIALNRGIDESYQNLAKINVIVTRRGKGGKPRLDHSTLSVPIFYVDHDGFKKLMPEEGSRKHYVHIERHLPLVSDVMEIPALSFLGYATAVSRRLKVMSDKCMHKKWPSSKSSPINTLRKLPDYFSEDPEVYLEKYSNDNFRESFIILARRMASSLIRMHLSFDINRATNELHAAEFLQFANSGEFIPKDAKDKANEYNFTDDDDMLQRTITFHKRLKNEIEKLAENKKKKKKS